VTARLTGQRSARHFGRLELIACCGSAAEPAPSDGDVPRRLLFGGAALGLSLIAIKRFGVDGNMEELKLAPYSLKGRIVVITGGNTGLGLESAKRLASAGATVVLTARSDDKGRLAEAAVRAFSGNNDVHYLQLDLADMESIRSFPRRYAEQPFGDRIDVLMNNAGVMAIPERLQTKDGFERQLGVNHLGHFALVGLLLPLLRSAKGFARVINVSSTAHLGATKEMMEGDLMAPERYTQWGAYCQSKLANVLFSKELDRRFKAAGIQATAVSLHPGGVDTDLARWTIAAKDDPIKAKQLVDDAPPFKVLKDFLTRNVQLGANTQIYLAAGIDGDGALSKSGGEYFDNMRPGLLNPVAEDAELARSLWDKSEKLTGVKIDL